MLAWWHHTFADEHPFVAFDFFPLLLVIGILYVYYEFLNWLWQDQICQEVVAVKVQIDCYVDVVGLAFLQVNSIITDARSVVEMHWAPSFTNPAVLANAQATIELLRLLWTSALARLDSLQHLNFRLEGNIRHRLNEAK